MLSRKVFQNTRPNSVYSSLDEFTEEMGELIVKSEGFYGQWSTRMEGSDYQLDFPSGMYIFGNYNYTILGVHDASEVAEEDKELIRSLIEHSLSLGNEIVFHFSPVWLRAERELDNDEELAIEFSLRGAKYVENNSPFAPGGLQHYVPAWQTNELESMAIDFCGVDLDDPDSGSDFARGHLERALSQIEGMATVYDVLDDFSDRSNLFHDIDRVKIVNPEAM